MDWVRKEISGRGSSIEECIRERAGEADACNWSQVNEARVKGWEQSSSSRLPILLLPLLFQVWNGIRKQGSVDGERIAAAKTNSASLSFKNDIFTVLNWKFRLDIFSVSTVLYWKVTAFSNSFYRFICKKSAVFSCLLETTCILVFSECRDSGDWDQKRCFIVCCLAQSLSPPPPKTVLFFLSPQSLNEVFPNVHFLSLVWMFFRLKVKNTILVIV